MSETSVNQRKVAMIGCGFVGSATAFALMESGLFSEMVLIDADKNRAEGEALDISHGLPFARPMKIYAGDYDDIVDAAIIIVTAGANQKPVDILTYTALKLSGFPENRVLGSGTVLDTARLKYNLGEHLNVDSRSVHAFIIGEHGDSELAAWSSATVSGVPINTFCEMRGHFNHDEATERIAENVKNSAYEIIAKKKATYFGVAMAVRRICEAIIRDEKSILPVSNLMHGEFGISDISLSMPAIVGANGVENRIPISLDEEETEKLKSSAGTLKKIIEEVL